jgi:vacuolar-type H+-ATPase subunit I/STV1
LLTAWLTAVALAGMAVAVLWFGGPEGLQAALRGVVAQLLERVSQRPLADQDRVAEALALVIPGIIAASWMMMSVANGALAQGLLARFGASWRPSPDLAQLGLPVWVSIVLGVAALATVFVGMPRFVGINMMIALTVPFGLAGLAVLHAAVRRLPHPGMALVGFYTMAGLLGWPLLAIAVLGLLDSWLGLRRRLAPHGVSVDG